MTFGPLAMRTGSEPASTRSSFPTLSRDRRRIVPAPFHWRPFFGGRHRCARFGLPSRWRTHRSFTVPVLPVSGRRVLWVTGARTFFPPCRGGKRWKLIARHGKAG